jgi:protein SCO1
MNKRVTRMACALLAWAAVLPEEGMVVHADDAVDHHVPHQAAGEPAPIVQAGSVHVRVLDLDLVNHEGEPVKFKRDVVSDKLIVMNFIYTRCTTACPILSLTFSRLQKMLGARLGQEVVLVSISVDPTTDIPPRLKEYAQRHRARPGWVFLTGDRSNVKAVLSGFGAYSPTIDDHPAMIVVGDARQGTWSRYYGFPAPEQILARLDELQSARQAAGVGSTPGDGPP